MRKIRVRRRVFGVFGTRLPKDSSVGSARESPGWVKTSGPFRARPGSWHRQRVRGQSVDRGLAPQNAEVRPFVGSRLDPHGPSVRLSAGSTCFSDRKRSISADDLAVQRALRALKRWADLFAAILVEPAVTSRRESCAGRLARRRAPRTPAPPGFFVEAVGGGCVGGSCGGAPLMYRARSNSSCGPGVCTNFAGSSLNCRRLHQERGGLALRPVGSARGNGRGRSGGSLQGWPVFPTGDQWRLAIALARGALFETARGQSSGRFGGGSGLASAARATSRSCAAQRALVPLRRARAAFDLSWRGAVALGEIVGALDELAGKGSGVWAGGDPWAIVDAAWTNVGMCRRAMREGARQSRPGLTRISRMNCR
jgi:hypothetical protein